MSTIEFSLLCILGDTPLHSLRPSRFPLKGDTPCPGVVGIQYTIRNKVRVENTSAGGGPVAPIRTPKKENVSGICLSRGNQIGVRRRIHAGCTTKKNTAIGTSIFSQARI